MKKNLLTLVAVFCFTGLAVAQEPAKVAGKRVTTLTPTKQSVASKTVSSKVTIKDAAMKARKEGKVVKTTSPTSSKAALAADRKAN